MQNSNNEVCNKSGDPAAAGEGRRTTNSRPTDLTFKVLRAVFLTKHCSFGMRGVARTEKRKAIQPGDFRFACCGFDEGNLPVVCRLCRPFFAKTHYLDPHSQNAF